MGYYDFLRITQFDSLDRIDAPDEPSGQRSDSEGRDRQGAKSHADKDKSAEHREDLWDASWRSSSDLVLVQLQKYPPSDAFFQKLVSPQEVDPAVNPLLAVIRVTLSPLVFDFPYHEDWVLDAIGNIIERMEEKRQVCGDGFEMSYFATLGGPDLVAIAIPRTMGHLWSIERVVRRTRVLTLAEIEQGRTKECLDKLRAAKWPGHGCVSVEPMLAFREESLDYFSTEEFRESAKNIPFRLRYRLRVDCGHEDLVASEVLNVLPADVAELARKELRATWGHYSLDGRLDQFDHFVKIWQQRWFADGPKEDERWRERHLIDTITTISFDERHADDAKEPVHPGRVWKLLQSVKKSLDLMRRQLQRFADEFLSRRQGAELMGLYASFHRCFFRHDHLGTARDLYPFFHQLCRALSLEEDWRAYLARDGGVKDYQSFTDEIGRLISHVGRAIRNRIEHRSLQSDPPTPHTLSNGACKVINSYSVVFWLAAELFRRTAVESPDRLPGDAEQFAGCVCAGSHGYILCDELFADFRKFVQNRRRRGQGGLPKELADQPAGDWSRPLLLLDISGQSLFRPELCFVHCLHEMAELSDWIRSSRCTNLRATLNSWVMHEVEIAFRMHLADQLCRTEQNDISSGNRKAMCKRLGAFPEHYLLCCVAKHLLRKNTSSGKEIREACREFLSGDVHPVDLVYDLRDALHLGAADNIATVKLVRDAFAPNTPDVAASVCADALRSDGFCAHVYALREYVAETLADIGMWMALDHVLSGGFGFDAERTSANRFADLSRVYCSLLTCVTESRGAKPDRSRIEEMIVQRWAVQAAAILGEDAWRDAVLASIREHNQRDPATLAPAQAVNFLDNANKYKSRVGDLAAALRRFRAYGGTGSAPMFPVSSAFGQLERELLRAFCDAWKHPTSGDRMYLLMDLWAASGRFGLDRILEQV